MGFYVPFTLHVVADAVETRHRGSTLPRPPLLPAPTTHTAPLPSPPRGQSVLCLQRLTPQPLSATLSFFFTTATPGWKMRAQQHSRWARDRQTVPPQTMGAHKRKRGTRTAPPRAPPPSDDPSPRRQADGQRRRRRTTAYLLRPPRWGLSCVRRIGEGWRGGGGAVWPRPPPASHSRFTSAPVSCWLNSIAFSWGKRGEQRGFSAGRPEFRSSPPPTGAGPCGGLCRTGRRAGGRGRRG